MNFDANVGHDPVLVSHCQTDNGDNEVVTRARNVTAGAAELRLQEEEGRDGDHTDEQVGFLVATRTSADLTTGIEQATDAWTSVDLSGVPATDPVVLASIGTYDGNDPAGVRLRNVGSGQVDLFLEEETSKDDETTHHRGCRSLRDHARTDT
ncbi:MAG: hypothetical protein ABEJ08_05990 [Halobacteriaceae archaeon]